MNGGAGISNTVLFEPGLGYTGLLNLQYDFTKVLSANVGLGYEKKGAKDDILMTDEEGNSIYNMNISQDFEYLTVPILIRANIGSGVKYYCNIGPSFNYLIKQSSKVDSNNDAVVGNSDNTSSYKRFELDLSIGAGVSFPLTESIALTTEIRDNIGLTNLSKIDGATAKTNSLSLIFGLTYKL